MSISSVGMCQEICHQENIDQFAVQVGIRFAQDATDISFLSESNLICIDMNYFFLLYKDKKMFVH